MKILQDIFANQYFIAAALSWFMAQLIKMIIELSSTKKKSKIKTKDFLIRACFGTGGMPSSHSATVSSVATSIGLIDGFSTPLFALAFVFAFVVIRDASGVRLSAGKQAKTINELIYKANSTGEKIQKVKEVRGHTPFECFVGATIGIIVSIGLFLSNT